MEDPVIPKFQRLINLTLDIGMNYTKHLMYAQTEALSAADSPCLDVYVTNAVRQHVVGTVPNAMATVVETHLRDALLRGLPTDLFDQHCETIDRDCASIVYRGERCWPTMAELRQDAQKLATEYALALVA